MGHVSSSGTTSHTLSLEVYPLKDMREGGLMEAKIISLLNFILTHVYTIILHASGV